MFLQTHFNLPPILPLSHFRFYFLLFSFPNVPLNQQPNIYIYIYTGVKLGSSVSLSAVLQEDVDRARRKQMIALQHRLIEVSSGPEEPVQSVLAWRSSSAAGPTSSNDAAAGGKAPKAAATASEAVFSLN